MTQIEVQEVQGVQEVQWVQIRPIRLIRGKTEEPILWRTALQAEASWCAMNPRALPPVTHGSALQAPECLLVLVRIPVFVLWLRANPSYPSHPW